MASRNGPGATLCSLDAGSLAHPDSYTRRVTDAEVEERGAVALARSTAIFSVLTAISRVMGLVREIVARRYFGVEGSINAFTVAFQVPNLVRALVADLALSSAFVPVFSELLEKGEKARAWRVASSLFFLFALGLTALTALFVLLAPWIMRPFGYEGEQEDLVVGLSRVLFPVVALLGCRGSSSGSSTATSASRSRRLARSSGTSRSSWRSWSACRRRRPSRRSSTSTRAAILVGTVIQVLLPFPWLMRLDGRLRLVIDWRDPAVRRVFVLMLPVTLGLGLINFNLVVNSFFAARFIDPELAPASIDAAFRLYMLPQGIFSVAVATVLFPRLSRLAASGDWTASGPRSRSAYARSRSCWFRRARSAPRSPCRSSGCSTSAARSRRTRRTSSRERWPRSWSVSRSTGRC